MSTSKSPVGSPESRTESPVAMPAALRAKVLGQIAKEPSPTRTEWTRRIVIATTAGVIAALGVFVGVGGVELGRRPAAYVASVSAVWAACWLAALPWALMRGRSSVGRAHVRLINVLGLPLLALGALLVGSALWPETRAIDDGRSDLRCFVFALLLAASPYLAFLWAKRRMVLVHATLEAAVAGVFAGTLGALLITLRCQCSEISHLVIGHLLPVLTLGALSAVIAGRWLRRGLPS